MNERIICLSFIVYWMCAILRNMRVRKKMAQMAGGGIILEKKRGFLLKNLFSSATICNDVVGGGDL